MERGRGQKQVSKSIVMGLDGACPDIISGKVAVGLCFSDMKLLEQFSAHPRKTPVVSGLSREVLDEIPSYVPGDLPTVPGHEAVLRIVAVGDRVRGQSVGRRVLVDPSSGISFLIPVDDERSASGIALVEP